MKLNSILNTVKKESMNIAISDTTHKNNILKSLIKILDAEKSKILKMNELDVQMARKNKKNEAFVDRLTLTEHSIQQMIEQIKMVIKLADPIEEIIEQRTLENGVLLRKVRIPIGVIAIIYESRPNVTIDAAILCIKSGNAVILKGGSEAINTNKILIECIKQALDQNNLSEHIVEFLDSTDHKMVADLVQKNEYIDLVIPRGGYSLVQNVVRHSRIPVLYHASGGARIYIDKTADLNMAINICINAKTNRPATCNSLDTVVVHKDVAHEFLSRLKKQAESYNIELLGDRKVNRIIPVTIINESEYATEFLDLKLSIKIVDTLEDAVTFIKRYTKKHSEGIIAQDSKVIEYFSRHIDAAGLFINCSTRLHDGSIFGLGAEMGIATGKFHARGPVGLTELTTYKWLAQGQGHIRL